MVDSVALIGKQVRKKLRNSHIVVKIEENI